LENGKFSDFLGKLIKKWEKSRKKCLKLEFFDRKSRVKVLIIYS